MAKLRNGFYRNQFILIIAPHCEWVRSFPAPHRTGHNPTQRDRRSKAPPPMLRSARQRFGATTEGIKLAAARFLRVW